LIAATTIKLITTPEKERIRYMILIKLFLDYALILPLVKVKFPKSRVL
jgi:hypothetical protein